jgi:hypothetical protein
VERDCTGDMGEGVDPRSLLSGDVEHHGAPVSPSTSMGAVIPRRQGKGADGDGAGVDAIWPTVLALRDQPLLYSPPVNLGTPGCRPLVGDEVATGSSRHAPSLCTVSVYRACVYLSLYRAWRRFTSDW